MNLATGWLFHSTVLETEFHLSVNISREARTTVFRTTLLENIAKEISQDLMLLKTISKENSSAKLLN